MIAQMYLYLKKQTNNAVLLIELFFLIILKSQRILQNYIVYPRKYVIFMTINSFYD